jgi:glycosyltransferase involved in cell wall biosynthesis
MRRPVVSTSYGADGLNLLPEHHLLIADSVREFAAAVNLLLSDPEKKNRLAESGWRIVNQEHDWHQMVAKAIDLFRTVALKPSHAGK